MTTYYVDSLDGNDSHAGTSEREAWRNLNRLIDASLAPGDSVLLRRGSVWASERGHMLAWLHYGTAAAPVTYGSYGAGPRPTIQLDAQNLADNMLGLNIIGAYLVFHSLRVTLTNPYRNPAYVAPDGQGAKFGWLVGASISGHHITLDDCEFDHLALGVNLTDGSHDCTITACHFHDLDALWELGGAPGIMGALGVMLHGTDNVVAANRFERNSVECTIKATGAAVNYGGPVEFYNANRCVFTRNVSLGSSRKHGEMGKDNAHTSADNEYSHNLIVSDRAGARGPNIHGADEFGPVTGTRVLHNTILLTGADSQALISGQAGATIADNVLVAKGKSAYLKTPLTLGNNLFWGSRPQFSIVATPSLLYADPLLDADYRPLPSSPCLGAATDGTSIGALQPVTDVDAAAYAAALAELDRLTTAYYAADRERAELALSLSVAKAERDAARADLTKLRTAVGTLAGKVQAEVTAGTIRSADAEELMVAARALQAREAQALDVVTGIGAELAALAVTP